MTGKIWGELAGTAGAQAFQGGDDKASGSKPKKQKTWAEPTIKGFDAAFIHSIKPKSKGWKKMSMVKKAAYINKEQASKLGDEEMAEGDSASTEADQFWLERTQWFSLEGECNEMPGSSHLLTVTSFFLVYFIPMAL